MEPVTITQNTAALFKYIKNDLTEKFGSSSKDSVRFEVFTAVTMKNAVFWDVAQCRSCVNGRFG
jgi:hypothetical protein